MAEPGSRPIPGAGASPVIRRPALQDRRTERLRPRAGLAMVRARMGVSPARASLRRSGEGSGRRLRLHSRQRTRRLDARARRIRRLSGGGAADGSCRRRAGRSSAAAPISSMRRTGPNTAHMCATAVTKCAFRSIRSLRIRRSTRSASITTRRSRIGATGRITRILRLRAASTMWITCAVASAAARLSTGFMPTRLPEALKPARRSPMERMASRGCFARKTSCRGGRTCMWNASAASRSAPPPGRRNRSRSG